MAVEEYIVSALKYRPSEWDEVVGQSGITSTLKNAIAQEEIAKAYLFCGPRGVGKTTSARIFAKAINAQYIPEGTDLSFNVFELDAASNNSVDDIRQLIDQVRIQPQLGKYKVYIIDEVHMLSTQAFNAFLKTLEEPPPHAIFILATTEKHKVLPTILSRCQIYDFQRIQVRDMVAHLAHIARDQEVVYDEEALHLIATKADGALRDALSLFDQMVSFTGKKLNYKAVAENLNVLDHEYYGRIVQAIVQGHLGATMLVYDEILKKGFDSLLFMIGLAEHLRNLLVAKDPATIGLLDAPDAVKQAYLTQSNLISPTEIVAHLEVLQQTESSYRAAKNKRLLTEVTLMRLCAAHGISPTGESEKKKSLVLPTEAPVIQDSRLPKSGLTEKAIQQDTVAQAPEERTVKESSGSPEVTNKSDKNPEELESAPVIPMPPIEIPDPNGPMRAQSPSSEELILNAVKIKEETSGSESSVSETIKEPLVRTRRKNRGISLSELDEEDATETLSTIENETHLGEGKRIEQADLMLAWKDYAEQIYAQKKYSFHSTLINRDPEILDDHSIRITIENEVQKEHLNAEKAALMEFVRAKLDHPGLRLEAVVVEEEQENIAFKTPREQLKEMVKKNPTLQKLYEDFDLDIE